MPKIKPVATDTAVRKLKATDKRFDERFWRGLEVRVYPNKIKTFQYVYESPVTNKRRRMTFGQYDPKGQGLTVEDANALHYQAMQLVKQGLDPQIEREKQALANSLAHEQDQRNPSVAGLLDEFLQLKKSVKEQTLKDYESIIRNHVLPFWELRKANEITQKDVRILITELVRAGKEKRTGHVISALQSLFGWGLDAGLLDYNPALGVSRPIKSKPKDRDLSKTEIAVFLERMQPFYKAEGPQDRVPLDSIIRDLLMGLLLTGQRIGELAGATWDEIQDGTGGRLWVIPSERTKNGLEHRLPITPMFEELLNRRRIENTARRVAYMERYKCEVPESQFVFPGRLIKDASKHVTNGVSSRLQKWLHSDDLNWPFEGGAFTPHDLRRTVRTQLGEAGVSEEIGERILNHKRPGLVHTYDRGKYENEMRRALNLWEARLQEIASFAARPQPKD